MTARRTVLLEAGRSAQGDARSKGNPHGSGAIPAGETRNLLFPLSGRGRFIGFLGLGEKRSGEPYTKEDKELLATVANQTALALVYAGLIRNEAERLKVRDEIAIARTVQERLFPQSTPAVAGLDYVGVCHPAGGVGGDCYDFIDLGKERLGIAVGDVAGKGVSAALLMASLQAMLRIHADAHGEDVDRLVSDINNLLCGMTDSNRFATFFYGVYDGIRGTLTYVNAGHNPPLLFRNAPAGSLGAMRARPLGELEIPRAEVEKLAPTGLVLGVLPDTSYNKVSLTMSPGDVLVIYTDGFTEATDEAGREYGEEGLVGALQAVVDQAPEVIENHLFHDVGSFRLGVTQHDDMTLVVAKKT